MSSVGAADLPTDVLNRIQSLLPIEDYVRFPAVCASWRSAAKQNPNLHSDGMPWLFDLSDSCFIAFRPSPANDRPLATYKIPIPESLPISFAHTRVVSSVGSRLALCDPETQKLLLVNPFSTSSWTHYLPTDVISDRLFPFPCFWKIVAPPDYDGSHGIALALYLPKGRSTLAYTASGNPWTDLPDEYEYDSDEYDSDDDEDHGQRFVDAVHYKDALFFAVREDDDDENVIALDFSSLSSSCSCPAVIDMTLNLVDDYLSVTKTYPGSYKDARLVISPPYLY